MPRYMVGGVEVSEEEFYRSVAREEREEELRKRIKEIGITVESSMRNIREAFKSLGPAFDRFQEALVQFAKNAEPVMREANRIMEERNKK